MNKDTFKLKPPTGKTIVRLNTSPYQQQLVKGDVCYVDGYVTASDNLLCLVLVRLSDGVFGFADGHQVTAITYENPDLKKV